MFYHKNMALDGLFPGLFSTVSATNLGYFETQVIITPVVHSGGGGYVPSYSGKPDRYRVTVRVKVNGVWHEDTKIVDDSEARVSAKLYGVTKFADNEVMVSVNGIQVFGDQIQVIANFETDK